MSINKAAYEGNLVEVKSLVEKGIDVNSTDNAGWAPLIIASHFGHKDIVAFLLEKNANIDATNKEGATALMFASIHGHKNIVEMLILHRASIDLKDCFGETALWGASFHEHYDICELLLHNGANLWVTNYKGWNITGNYFNANGDGLGVNFERRNKILNDAYETGKYLMANKKITKK